MYKPLNPSDLAHRDIDVELAQAEHMARTMDLVIDALMSPRSTYEQDRTCPLCGRREIHHTRDPNAPGAVMAVCNACAGA